MADRGPSELGKWSGTPSRLAADGQSGHPRPWPDCLLRWIPLIGVTAAVCAPAFVTAQVPAEPVEIEERLEVPAPARALGAVKAKGKATANAKASVKTDAKAKAEMDLMKAVTTIRKKRAAPAAPVVVDRQPVLRLNGGMVDARTQQFRQILRIEYLFVKAIFDPSKNDRILIAGAGFKALDDAVAEYAAWQRQPNRRIGPGGELLMAPDVRKCIQDGLAAAIKARLSPAEAEQYRVELEARSAEIKRMAILNYVVKLDQMLLLSDDQRTKLIRSLSTHWDEPWAVGLQALNRNLQVEYLPSVPDSLISPYLDDRQKEIWSGIPKVKMSLNSTAAMPLTQAGANMIDDPIDEDFSDQVARDADLSEPKP